MNKTEINKLPSGITRLKTLPPTTSLNLLIFLAEIEFMKGFHCFNYAFCARSIDRLIFPQQFLCCGNHFFLRFRNIYERMQRQITVVKSYYRTPACKRFQPGMT